MHTMELTWTDEEGNETTHTFPSENFVCDRCEGFGTILNPSIGEHAYSMEEFNESFDEDQRQEYFRRGGMYDITCIVCNGNRVVAGVAEGLLTDEEKVLFEEYEKYQDRQARYDADDAATYRAENGYR